MSINSGPEEPDNDWSIITCNNRTKFHKYIVEEKKPDAKEYILDYSTQNSEKANWYAIRSQDSCYAGDVSN